MWCLSSKRYFQRHQPRHVQVAKLQTRLKNYLGHNSGNVRVLSTYQQKEMLVMLKKRSFLSVSLEQNDIKALWRTILWRLLQQLQLWKRNDKSRKNEKQFGGKCKGKTERNLCNSSLDTKSLVLGRIRPFLSSLVPLFQNESKCESFHMKMNSACSFIFMQIKVIFLRMISHLDSLWNRGPRELGNGLLWQSIPGQPNSSTLIEIQRFHVWGWSLTWTATKAGSTWFITTVSALLLPRNTWK